jgi:hypothetical protein
MSGSVETEHGAANEAPADERAGHRYVTPKPPRHLSALPFARPQLLETWSIGDTERPLLWREDAI